MYKSDKDNSNEFSGILTKHSTVSDITGISLLMMERGLSPYIFIYESYRNFENGNNTEAYRLLKIAGLFEGVFYCEDQVKDNDYRQTVRLLNYIITNNI